RHTDTRAISRSLPRGPGAGGHAQVAHAPDLTRLSGSRHRLPAHDGMGPSLAGISRRNLRPKTFRLDPCSIPDMVITLVFQLQQDTLPSLDEHVGDLWKVATLL